MGLKGHNRTLKRRSGTDDRQRSVSQQPLPPDTDGMRFEQVLLLCGSVSARTPFQCAPGHPSTSGTGGRQTGHRPLCRGERRGERVVI